MTLTQNQSEILNKIWNPDLPIVLIDPPLTTQEAERIAKLDLFLDARITYPNLIGHPNPKFIKCGAASVTGWAALLDRHFQRRIYGSAVYAGNYSVYYLGSRPITEGEVSGYGKAQRYWYKNVDAAQLSYYMQLTADLIKRYV